jgi:hypothetical protein
MNKWVHKEEVELENSWNTGPLKLMDQEYNQAQQTNKKIQLKQTTTQAPFSTPPKKRRADNSYPT